MDPLNMLLLSNDPKRYNKGFEEFEKRSYSYAKYHAFLTNVASTLFKTIAINRPSDNKFRILSVGAGTGEKDCLIIDSLLQKYNKIHQAVIEPNTNSIGKFQDRVELEMEGKDVKFDWKNEHVEEYLSDVNNKQKFHFIHCIHSLYYTSDPIDIIKQLYDRLAEGGVIMIVHHSEKGDVRKVYSKVQKFLNRGTDQITGDDIFRYFQTHNFPCTFDCIDTGLDVTNCYDESSIEGNELLDFMTNIVDFRRSVPRELKDSVMEMFTERRIDVCNKSYFTDDHAKIIIFKGENTK